MAGSVSLEEMYASYDTLTGAKENAKEHLLEYMKILSGVRGNAGAKRLSARFIPQFYKFFPDLYDTAMDAMIDLCEEDDTNVRAEAIRCLPTLGRNAPDTIKKIADILTQLLQTDDPKELDLVKKSIHEIFRINPQDAMSGVFNQLHQDETGDYTVIERALDYIRSELAVNVLPDLLKENPKVEGYFIAEIKKVIEAPDVNGEEFQTFVGLLQKLDSFKKPAKKQELLDVIAGQLRVDQPFDTSDEESWNRIHGCMSMANSLELREGNYGKISQFVCSKVVPAYQHAPAELRYPLLQACAEIVASSVPEDATQPLPQVFEALVACLPKPADDGSEPPSMELAYLECLLFIFHALGRKDPGFLTGPSMETQFADFRKRLQYCARHTQQYAASVRKSLAAKIADKAKLEQLQLAQRMTENILAIVKDLFYNPPAYKTPIRLSWAKQPEPTKAAPAQVKAQTKAQQQQKPAPATKQQQQQQQQKQQQQSQGKKPAQQQQQQQQKQGARDEKPQQLAKQPGQKTRMDQVVQRVLGTGAGAKPATTTTTGNTIINTAANKAGGAEAGVKRRASGADAESGTSKPTASVSAAAGGGPKVARLSSSSSAGLGLANVSKTRGRLFGSAFLGATQQPAVQVKDASLMETDDSRVYTGAASGGPTGGKRERERERDRGGEKKGDTGDGWGRRRGGGTGASGGGRSEPVVTMTTSGGGSAGLAGVPQRLRRRIQRPTA